MGGDDYGFQCCLVSGRLLVGCWLAAGRLLVGCWLVAGRLLIGCWFVAGLLPVPKLVGTRFDILKTDRDTTRNQVEQAWEQVSEPRRRSSGLRAKVNPEHICHISNLLVVLHIYKLAPHVVHVD